MEDVEGKKKIPVREIAPKRWFTNPLDSTFVLRIYSCLGITFENVNQVFKEATGGDQIDDQVFLGLYVMGGLKYSTGKPFLCWDESGILKIIMDFPYRELPHSSYVLLFTPKKVDGKELLSNEVKQRLDLFAGTLRGHTGSNFMRNLVFEGEFWAGEDKSTSLSEALRMPKATEGPHFNHNNWLQTKSILDALKKQPMEIRKRLELAIEFFNKAIDEDDSFFNYWTSLEIVCNGKSGTIRHKIMEALGLKSLEAVEQLGFKEIARWRHNFFHNGVRPSPTAETDRYLQLLFIDLLRHELGLKPIKHTLAMIENGGYDLAIIGVPPRPENKNVSPSPQ